MQKCASPQRTPHALPGIFAGGFHSQAVEYTHVVAFCVPTSRNSQAGLCGHMILPWNSLWDCCGGACLDMQAHMHAQSPVGSPEQRVLACMRSATEARQLSSASCKLQG